MEYLFAFIFYGGAAGPAFSYSAGNGVGFAAMWTFDDMWSFLLGGDFFFA